MNRKIKNSELQRRLFLKRLLAATTASMLPLAGGQSRAASRRKSNNHSKAAPAVIRKIIPSSGEKLPVIGLGTSRTFDLGHDMGYDRSGYDNLLKVMQAFFEGGGTLIDSSPMYGSSEKVVGTLLKLIPKEQEFFSATKVWIDGEQQGKEQMEQSRFLWGVKRFDLMQIHNLRDWNVHLKTIKRMKEEGKIRYIGITTSHGRYHPQLETILQKESFDFVQLSYNIVDREVEQRLLPLAADRGVAVIVNRPYQRGSLFSRVRGERVPPWVEEFDCQSWGQFFLKFIISHPAVSCTIPATTKVHHMQDNMQA
ncbi:MAG: aldo/keto reductase, partial [Gammaproteobacteria bacterium]|nr:aldo/keto reductase [Gammaproteobacteria bacterium]